jgi:hypothetical protein
MQKRLLLEGPAQFWPGNKSPRAFAKNSGPFAGRKCTAFWRVTIHNTFGAFGQDKKLPLFELIKNMLDNQADKCKL